MSDVTYKGYIIRPAPYHLRDGGWSHELYIARDKGHEVVERQFSSATTFPTKADAVEHCTAFGKQIIDGVAANCTVADL